MRTAGSRAGRARPKVRSEPERLNACEHSARRDDVMPRPAGQTSKSRRLGADDVGLIVRHAVVQHALRAEVNHPVGTGMTGWVRLLTARRDGKEDSG